MSRSWMPSWSPTATTTTTASQPAATWPTSLETFHSTQYVASLMRQKDLPSVRPRHRRRLPDRTGARRGHTRRPRLAERVPGASNRIFQRRGLLRVLAHTPDGTIWAPGDSRLIPDHHLTMPTPDAMIFDFSDSEWHFGLDGAVEMANAYPHTPLLLHHWGSVDAPDFPPFNADPASLPDRVDNPDRVHVLAPGEPFVLRRLPS